MADVFNQEERSSVMRRVRSKGNKSTELKLITFFKEQSIHGWRRNYNVIGHPDFVFLKQRIAVFVDGCFWHGHDCRNTRPASNQEYWERKRRRNAERDRLVTERLASRGWTVVRIWECELLVKNRSALEEKLQPILTSNGGK